MLDEIDVGPNIARNQALKENIFMMVVCIEKRIPLFLVGKPGSSKSLAKTIVADAMQGNAAKSPLFKTFKAVSTLYYDSIHSKVKIQIHVYCKKIQPGYMCVLF